MRSVLSVFIRTFSKMTALTNERNQTNLIASQKWQKGTVFTLSFIFVFFLFCCFFFFFFFLHLPTAFINH